MDERVHALVTDFGLVCATETNVGTPAYMAPEQWRAEVLDERTDVYAYGCILYEMFSAQRVFPALTIEDLAVAHLTMMPPPLRRVTSSVPVDLEEFVFRCLAKNPAHRPKEWGEVVRECSACFSQLTGKTPPLDTSDNDLTVEELITAANSLVRLDKHEGALAICERGIRIRSTSPSLWDVKGVALQQLGRIPDGLTAHEQALTLDADNPVAWNNKGIALTHLGRTDEALDAYNRALAIDPTYDSAGTNKCWLLLNAGRAQEAVLACDEVLAQAPDCSEAWNNRGTALDKLGLVTAALLSYERAVAIAPWYATAWYNKGLAHRQLKEPAAELSAYDNGVHANPNYKEAWNNKGDVLI